jgi:putative DNA primase/helicase
LGFWRRFLVVDFPADFSRDGKTKKEILDTLKPLLPATLAWAVVGATRAMGKGVYTMPQSTKRVLDEWRTESDSVAYWVAEARLRKSSSRTTRASVLYEAYSRWSTQGGFKQLSRTTFGHRLANLGFRKKRGQRGVCYYARFSTKPEG